MRPFYLYIFFLFCFFLPAISHGQEEEETIAPPAVEQETPPAPKRYYVLSPRVSVTVPHPLGNSSFKQSFVGIYEVSGGLNVYLYKGIFLGGTYKNGLLKITENKIPDYNASMYINNAGGRIGADMYIGDKNRVIYSASVAIGQNWTHYSGLVSKDKSRVLPTTYTCTYYEPEMSIFFLIESNFGIGATLSYTVYNKNFDPYELALDDWTQFSKNVAGSTQYFSFGFGFYYSLWRKKGKERGGY
ncbi:MAG: hypothetical protein K0S44_3122 [Bacteroidetes bacterium]|nr:hypothetical protein [Bacteroidota bacterium]